MEIRFSDNFQPEDGTTLSLLALPEGEQVPLDTIILESECFDAQGEIRQEPNEEYATLQVFLTLSLDDCSYFAKGSKIGALDVVALGGFV